MIHIIVMGKPVFYITSTSCMIKYSITSLKIDGFKTTKPDAVLSE